METRARRSRRPYPEYCRPGEDRRGRSTRGGLPLVTVAVIIVALLAGACGESEIAIDSSRDFSAADMVALLEDLAAAWQAQDTEAAVALFTPDAIYMQPPASQLFQGEDELRAYFGALRPGTTMAWHHVWFDPVAQIGAGEFTFGREGSDRATHGVAVVQIRDARISRWHEYLQPGPASREGFLAREGKSWEWHIGNYP